MKTILAAAASLALLTGAASAATLSASGSVQLNQGNGFRPVSGSVEVKAGDRILVGAGGSAQVAYGASCTRSVAPNSMSTVMASSPCTGLMRQDGSANTLPGGEMLLVGGVLGAAGLAGFIYTVSKDNKSSP